MILIKVKEKLNNIFSLSYILFIILLIFVGILIIVGKKEEENIIHLTSVINTNNLNKNSKELNLNIVGEDEIAKVRETLNLKEYENMPRKIDGFDVIGKISTTKKE